MGKARRDGGEDENDDSLDDDDGYCLNKYDDVEKLPLKMDWRK